MIASSFFNFQLNLCHAQQVAHWSDVSDRLARAARPAAEVISSRLAREVQTWATLGPATARWKTEDAHFACRAGAKVERCNVTHVVISVRLAIRPACAICIAALVSLVAGGVENVALVSCTPALLRTSISLLLKKGRFMRHFAQPTKKNGWS